MQSDKSATTPRGITVHFNEAAHTYWHIEQGSQLEAVARHTSVTQLTGGFFPAFDEDATAQRCAAKSGVAKEELIAAWHTKRDTACELGTRVHAIAEDCILNRQPRHQPRDNTERILFRNVWIAASKLREANKILGAEMLVANTRARIAGQIDLALRSPDGAVWLIDWKTNARIRTESQYGNTCLPPVTHLPECEVSKYSLQLSAYEWILRSEGYITKPQTPVHRSIIHIAPDGAREIPLPDLSAEIRDCVISHLSEPLPF